MLTVRINDTNLNQDVPMKDAARALIIKDDKVAILYSKKYQAYITPGGGVEKGETFKDACIREAKEETGMIVTPLEEIALLDCNYPRIRIAHHYFVCELVKDTNDNELTAHEVDQDLEVKWLSLSEVKLAFASKSPHFKYDIWMQREAAIIPELRKFLKDQ